MAVLKSDMPRFSKRKAEGEPNLITLIKKATTALRPESITSVDRNKSYNASRTEIPSETTLAINIKIEQYNKTQVSTQFNLPIGVKSESRVESAQKSESDSDGDGYDVVCDEEIGAVLPLVKTEKQQGTVVEGIESAVEAASYKDDDKSHAELYDEADSASSEDDGKSHADLYDDADAISDEDDRKSHVDLYGVSDAASDKNDRKFNAEMDKDSEAASDGDDEGSNAELYEDSDEEDDEEEKFPPPFEYSDYGNADTEEEDSDDGKVFLGYDHPYEMDENPPPLLKEILQKIENEKSDCSTSDQEDSSSSGEEIIMMWVHPERRQKILKEEQFGPRLAAEMKAMEEDKAKTHPGPKASSPVGPLLETLLPLTGSAAIERFIVLWNGQDSCKPDFVKLFSKPGTLNYIGNIRNAPV